MPTVDCKVIMSFVAVIVVLDCTVVVLVCHVLPAPDPERLLVINVVPLTIVPPVKHMPTSMVPDTVPTVNIPVASIDDALRLAELCDVDTDNVVCSIGKN